MDGSELIGLDIVQCCSTVPRAGVGYTHISPHPHLLSAQTIHTVPTSHITVRTYPFSHSFDTHTISKMGKTKFTKILKNSKEPKQVDNPKVVLHQEPKHNDDDEITASNFPFSVLIPNWSTFDPNTKNPAIGSKFASTHHGGSGGKKLSDFKTFRLACCLEFVDKEVAGVKNRVRCMNVFTVDSNQCTTHGKTTHKDGPNKIYTYMKRNQTATWGMIKDTNPIQDAVEIPEWQRDEQSREAAAAKLDEALASGLDADAAWASVSADLDDDFRVVERQDTALARGKGMSSDNNADSHLDVATMRRAALDEKLKNGNINRRKTGIKSAWRGMKLGGT